MPIGVQLNAAFNVDGTTYTANMNLPTTAPTGAAPFLFFVTSAPTGGGTAATLLTVAVGGQNQVYVAVQPPTSLITAAVGDVVQTLDVVVAEGTFNPNTNTFTGSTTTAGAAPAVA